MVGSLLIRLFYNISSVTTAAVILHSGVDDAMEVYTRDHRYSRKSAIESIRGKGYNFKIRIPSPRFVPLDIFPPIEYTYNHLFLILAGRSISRLAMGIRSFWVWVQACAKLRIEANRGERTLGRWE